MSTTVKRPAVKKGNVVTPIKITTKKIETVKSDKYDLSCCQCFSARNGEQGSIDDMIVLLKDYVDSDETLDLELNRRTIFNCEIIQLPHCCGIFELGAICFNTFKDEIKFFNGLAICKTGKTLMINTINTGQSARLAEVLVKCTNWTLVKTFKNSGSGNIIKIWMSNNN